MSLNLKEIQSKSFHQAKTLLVLMLLIFRLQHINNFFRAKAKDQELTKVHIVQLLFHSLARPTYDKIKKLKSPRRPFYKNITPKIPLQRYTAETKSSQTEMETSRLSQEICPHDTNGQEKKERSSSFQSFITTFDKIYLFIKAYNKLQHDCSEFRYI